MTLLEKAKGYRLKRKGRAFAVSDQHIELAIAWAKDEVTFMQTMIALTGSENRAATMYSKLALSLKAAVTQGRLQENSK